MFGCTLLVRLEPRSSISLFEIYLEGTSGVKLARWIKCSAQAKIGTIGSEPIGRKMNPNTIKINRGEHVSKFRLSDAADPRDGVRLIKAFLEIEEPALRGKLICLAEDLAKASSGCLGTAQGEESHRRAFRGFDILATPVED
jgi:hypothetical protein